MENLRGYYVNLADAQERRAHMESKLRCAGQSMCCPSLSNGDNLTLFQLVDVNTSMRTRSSRAGTRRALPLRF